MDESSIEEAVVPDEAFAVLADGNRIDILRSLWEIDESSVSFSELHETVDVADSGQFNYHLTKLTDQFVRKTEDGYALTAAGIRVVGAIESGAYTMAGSMDPIELEHPCPTCGGNWSFRYEDEFVRMDCSSCPLAIRYPVPPGTFVGVEPAEMPERTERYLRALVEQLRNDVCPYCESEIGGTVVVRGPPADSAATSSVPIVEYDCVRCSGDLLTDVASPLVTHPAVSAFYYERGVDVRERPLWEFTAFDEDHTTVEREEPLRVSVRFEEDGDALSVTVDETCTVRSIEGP